MAVRPCLDCGARTAGSRCARCTRRRERARNNTPQQRARLTITRAQRLRVYARDRYRCVNCGRTVDLTLDHVEPLARSRPRPCVRDDGLQTLCRPCNSRGGAHAPTKNA